MNPEGAYDETTVLRLLKRIDGIGRLNIEERRMLLELNNRVEGKRLKWHWSPKELREIDMFINRRARAGRPKPFRVNSEVADLAASLGRSYWATHRMIERRRKAKCSDASKSKGA